MWTVNVWKKSSCQQTLFLDQLFCEAPTPHNPEVDFNNENSWSRLCHNDPLTQLRQSRKSWRQQLHITSDGKTAKILMTEKRCPNGWSYFEGLCYSVSSHTPQSSKLSGPFATYLLDKWNDSSNFQLYLSMFMHNHGRNVRKTGIYFSDQTTHLLFKKVKYDDVIWEYENVEDPSRMPVKGPWLRIREPVALHFECMDGHFRCQDGTCILRHAWCDGVRDCRDGSDELRCDPVCSDKNATICVSTCKIPVCQCSTAFYQCKSGGCIPLSLVCDGTPNCADGFDEATCSPVLQGMQNISLTDPEISSIKTNIGSKQRLPNTLKRNICINNGDCGQGRPPCSHLQMCHAFECPDMFKCYMSFCVPFWLVCDGKWDCASGEDERECQPLVCPGMFKCREEGICLPLHEVCDGVRHCLISGDDEALCDVYPCPSKCICYGHTMVCSHKDVSSLPRFPTARGLLLSGNNQILAPDSLLDYRSLIVLDLSNCSIAKLFTNWFSNQNVLQKLNISYNFLVNIPPKTFRGLVSLTELDMRHNRLATVESHGFDGLRSLLALNLSYQQIYLVEEFGFKGMQRLQVLDLTGNHIGHLTEYTFAGLTSLKSVYLNGNPLPVVTADAFFAVQLLEKLISTRVGICCFKPNSTKECRPLSEGNISNCDRLLASTFVRIAIWLLGVCVFILNLVALMASVSLWLRTKHRQYISYIYLNGSDGMMGLYLLVLCVVDSMYQEEYAVIDHWWRQSWQCRITAFIALVSTEASSVAVLLITAVRFIVVRFPFTYRNRKKMVDNISFSIMILFLVFSLTKSILMETTSPLCLFFVTKENPRTYVKSIILISAVINAINFAVILICSVWMIHCIHASCKKSGRGWRSGDTRLVVRVALLNSTNFICWFLVCIVTVMSLAGQRLPDTLVIGVIMVMPINAILNPVIYCISSSEIRKGLQFKRRDTLSSSAARKYYKWIHKMQYYSLYLTVKLNNLDYLKHISYAGIMFWPVFCIHKYSLSTVVTYIEKQ